MSHVQLRPEARPTVLIGGRLELFAAPGETAF